MFARQDYENEVGLYYICIFVYSASFYSAGSYTDAFTNSELTTVNKEEDKGVKHLYSATSKRLLKLHTNGQFKRLLFSSSPLNVLLYYAMLSYAQ